MPSLIFLNIKCLFLLFFALLTIPFSAQSKTLNIATIDVAPFGFYTADNQPSGMMYEISNLIAEEAGIAYTNKILPYARTPYALKVGDSDFVLRYTNQQLSEEALQVVSVVPMQNIIVGLASNRYESLSDLHGKTVASVRGAVFDKKFTADTKIFKTDTNDYDQALKMLFNKRLSGVIGSRVGIYYTVHKLNYSYDQLGEPLLLNTKHFWLHFSKVNADQETIVKLKAATLKLQESGLINKIVDKYMGQLP